MKYIYFNSPEFPFHSCKIYGLLCLDFWTFIFFECIFSFFLFLQYATSVTISKGQLSCLPTVKFRDVFAYCGDFLSTSSYCLASCQTVLTVIAPPAPGASLFDHYAMASLYYAFCETMSPRVRVNTNRTCDRDQQVGILSSTFL